MITKNNNINEIVNNLIKKGNVIIIVRHFFYQKTSTYIHNIENILNNIQTALDVMDTSVRIDSKRSMENSIIKVYVNLGLTIIRSKVYVYLMQERVPSFLMFDAKYLKSYIKKDITEKEIDKFITILLRNNFLFTTTTISIKGFSK
jgi:hypothetical protein